MLAFKFQPQLAPADSGAQGRSANLRRSFKKLSSGIRVNSVIDSSRNRGQGGRQTEKALKAMSELALGLVDLARQAADASAPVSRGRLVHRAVSEVIESIEMNVSRLDTTLENIRSAGAA